MLDWNSILPALGIFISVVLTAVISYRVAAGSAKKADIATLEGSYKALQKTYQDENTHLNNELTRERNERRADRLACQEQITNQQTQILELQRQLTTLMVKLPEPGLVQPVKLVSVEPDLIVPMELKKPIPLTIKQVAEAAARAEAARAEGEASEVGQDKMHQAPTKETTS